MGTKVFFPKAVEHLAAEELDIVSGKPKQNIKKKIYIIYYIGILELHLSDGKKHNLKYLPGLHFVCSVCKKQRWSNWAEFSRHSFYYLDFCFSPCDMWKCPYYIDDVTASGKWRPRNVKE